MNRSATGGLIVERREGFNGLGTALYKTYVYLFLSRFSAVSETISQPINRGTPGKRILFIVVSLSDPTNQCCFSHSPCVVANLWDVTDRDIDRFLEFLLQTWLVAPTDGEHSLEGAVATCRDACRLPFLIGAAPVVYGFPIRSKVTAR